MQYLIEVVSQHFIRSWVHASSHCAMCHSSRMRFEVSYDTHLPFTSSRFDELPRWDCKSFIIWWGSSKKWTEWKHDICPRMRELMCVDDVKSHLKYESDSPPGNTRMHHIVAHLMSLMRMKIDEVPTGHHHGSTRHIRMIKQIHAAQHCDM